MQLAPEEAARDPDTHRYDETNAGWTPFLEAAATWYAGRFGVRLAFCKRKDVLTEALTRLSRLRSG